MISGSECPSDCQQVVPIFTMKSSRSRGFRGKMRPVADDNDDGILVDDRMISIAIGADCRFNECPSASVFRLTKDESPKVAGAGLQGDLCPPLASEQNSICRRGVD